MPGYDPENLGSMAEMKKSHMEAILRHQRWLDGLEKEEAQRAESAAIENERMLQEATRETWSLVDDVLQTEAHQNDLDRQSLEQAQSASAQADPLQEPATAQSQVFPII